MRIISDHHDYYDGLQAYGQDDGLIYLRKPKQELRERTRNTNDWREAHVFPFCKADGWWGDDRLSVRHKIVGFCGEIYPMVLVRRGDAPVKSTARCFNIDEVVAYVESAFKEDERRHWADRKHKSYHNWSFYQRKVVFEEFFGECEKKKTAYAEMFEAEKSPIFVAGYRSRGWSASELEIEWNANLKEVEFFRVVPTADAFQRIQMWLSNLANPEKELPKMSDKDMRDIKGFDNFSFKKEATKHKK